MKLFLKLLGLLFLVSPEISFAQILKGKINDTAGNPILAVSIYIEETKLGLICDSEGEFQVKLNSGDYHLKFSSIGYITEEMKISITDENLEIVIELKEKSYDLPEVEIHQGEDPAYKIMREAIAKAPYYQSIVKKSTYQIYSKISGKMTEFPKFLEKMTGEDLSIYKDKLFLQESSTEINFEAPDKYERNVIAYSSSFPNGNDPKEALNIGINSLYSPMFGPVISPLHPKAFNYYRFRYEGYEEDNGLFINKIRIIPKLKDHKLMEGLIYIADDEWNVRYADLHFSGMGVRQHTIYNYNPIAEGIYIVTNAKSHTEAQMLGVKLQVDFLHSFQYTDIQLNDSLLNLPKGKPKKEKKNLELNPYKNITADSLANNRDSIYWANTRTIALNEEELASYARKDTLQAHVDSIAEAAQNPKFKPTNLLTGGGVGRDSAFVRFTYSGLLGVLNSYNFVDGFWLGQKFSLDFKRGKNTGWMVKPAGYWTSARNAWIWETEVSLDYAPEKLGHFAFSVGNSSEDYSGDAGVENLVNSLYSLFYGKNLAKFHESRYMQISNSIDLANGLRTKLGFKTSQRSTLENHTTWNILGKKDNWTPNRPEYAQALNENYSNTASYFAFLEYTPEYYYRKINEKKQYVHSRFPTFSTLYQQGLKKEDHYSEFSSLEVSIHHKIQLGIFNQFAYRLTAGKFFNKNSFNYNDYKHFGTGGNTLFSIKSWDESYTLLPFYEFSTNKEWLQAFMNYRTDYLLLKRLPFLQGKIFNENLHFKFLHTSEKRYYSEWGYSIDLPGGICGVGIYSAFDKHRYNGWGIQISLPLFKWF